jgi:hypothetical protein
VRQVVYLQGFVKFLVSCTSCVPVLRSALQTKETAISVDVCVCVCVSGVKAIRAETRFQIHTGMNPSPPHPATFNGITPSFPGDRDLECEDTVRIAERTKNGRNSSVGVTLS